MYWIELVQKPMRAASPVRMLRHHQIGEAGRKPIETLRRRRAGRAIVLVREARERSPGEIPGQASDGEPWNAQTDGSYDRRAVKTSAKPPGTLERPNPRNRGLCGPACRLVRQDNRRAKR
jgi:hypothetical protein